MMKIKRKLDFYLSVALVIYVWANALSNYAGLNFPKPNELTYTTGTLSLYKNNYDANHLSIVSSEQGRDSQILACSYSVFGNGRHSDCGSKSFYKPYLDKEVTAGWYLQPKLGWFENKRPQLVTLESNGSMIIDYNSTIDLIKSRNNTGKFFMVFVIPLSILVYWAFGKVKP